VWTSLALMETLHFALLFAKGWTLNPLALLALPMMALNVMVMTALALLCSLTFTSAPTATVFTLFFWILGHFGEEIRFLTKKSNALLAQITQGILWILPNLSLLNLRDTLDVPGTAATQIFWATGYAVLYTAAALTLAAAFFSRKEF
jgi:hypothetical protein